MNTITYSSQNKGCTAPASSSDQLPLLTLAGLTPSKSRLHKGAVNIATVENGGEDDQEGNAKLPVDLAGGTSRKF